MTILIKIEDVIIDINQCENYKKSQKTEEPQQIENFTTYYDENKITDISSLGIVKKRNKRDEPKDDPEIGGKLEKKDI